VEPIAVVFTPPEDALRVVLRRIRAGATLAIDAFDRSGATRLASGSVVTVDNQIDQATGTVRLKAVFDNQDHALARVTTPVEREVDVGALEAVLAAHRTIIDFFD
jgi:membrane fusion protein, multidrug efflux system